MTAYSLPELQDREFNQFRELIYHTAGISMSDSKRALISGRLAKRLKHFGLDSYGDYLHLLTQGYSEEMQVAVDLLTTNETAFFREIKHFELLRDRLLDEWQNRSVKLWSAASSSGQEAYSLAMIMLSHCRHQNWNITATDVSLQMIERARCGQYPLHSSDKIPPEYLKKYCLRGVGRHSGTFIVREEVRQKVHFEHANLKHDLSRLGLFDLIMLRNVMIYFDLPTKQQVVQRLVQQLKPGGYLLVGHSETLNGINPALKPLMPSVYRKL